MYKYKTHIYCILYIVLATVTFSAYGQDDPRYVRIRESLEQFTRSYPQQKVYLHTDKDEYFGGEVIWFKAYLLNGINHVPDTTSTNLYVELFGPFSNPVTVKRFRLYNGFGTGNIDLSDTLPEGLYQIRAYTNWMQNFDVGYYFTKNFQLHNPGYVNIISPKQARENLKEINKKNDDIQDIDIQFMPEGGSLVYGLESVVGFKAVNLLGLGVDVTGDVFDNSDHKIVSFQSLLKGMGSFIIKPENDHRYYALIHYGESQIKVPLPLSWVW
jgi:hypothetical protein